MKIYRALILMVALIGMFGNDAFAVYDTSTGRFMQRDPKGYVDGASLYQYVRSSPLIFVDPLGLKLSIPGNSQGERDRFKKALNEICPDAEINIDPDGNVTLEGGCVDTESSDNPIGCACLNKAVNGGNTIRIMAKNSRESDQAFTEDYRRFPGIRPTAIPMLDMIYTRIPGSYTLIHHGDPSKRDIIIGMPGPNKTSPGSSRPPISNNGRVPNSDATELAHELCGHGVGDQNEHGDKESNPNFYRDPGDPAVVIENDIRFEMNLWRYGTRDGNI